MRSIRLLSVSSICLASVLLALPSIAAEPPEADREAILAMQGGYRVRFAFDETVPLAADYTPAEPSRSGADEVVILVEDSPDHIVLQHLLLHVATGHVTKHWRQEWTYEAARRWEFATDQRWLWRDIPAERIAGGWTQCVYEVSDAPRYCGTGRWDHALGVSTWTSDATWRPLPRRDYTKRDDYNVLVAVNRHTIVPGGWSHEQDNTKASGNPAGEITALIVREAGFNDYRRTDVRARWQNALTEPHGLHLVTAIDGMGLIEPLFKQAQAIVDGGTVDDAEIDAVFAQWVESAAGDEVLLTADAAPEQ